MNHQGFDSIVARGSQEPDPSKDVVIKIEGKSVSVPQGKPQPQAAYKGSRFSNSEYLVRFDICLEGVHFMRRAVFCWDAVPPQVGSRGKPKSWFRETGSTCTHPHPGVRFLREPYFTGLQGEPAAHPLHAHCQMLSCGRQTAI